MSAPLRSESVPDRIVFEREATLLRWFEPLLVPGLLQTEAYARAVLARDSLLRDAEVEEAVASRLDRQALLDRPDPPTLIAILDEGVLRRSAVPASAGHLLAGPPGSSGACGDQ